MAYFCRITIRILDNLILNVTKLFINDFGIKRPKIKYNNKKLFLKIR